MKLTIEQTDKILNKLKDYGFKVVWVQQPIVSDDYFNEKVNEALEVEK